MEFKQPFKPYGLRETLEKYSYPFLSLSDATQKDYLIHGLFILIWYTFIIDVWLWYITFYTIYWLVMNITGKGNNNSNSNFDKKNSSLPEFVIEGTILKKYNGDSEEVVIPEGITEISDTFSGVFCKTIFSSNKTLRSVKLPKSLKVIGTNAFHSCLELTSVEIPGGVEKISMGAFGSCEKLEQVKLPKSLKIIEGNVFSNAGLTSIKIPSGVESIESEVFHNCKKLEEAILPEGLKTIKKFAFSGCTGLEAIEIPSTVTKIEEKAFEGCTNLKCVFFYGTAEIAQDALPPDAKIVKKGANIPLRYRLGCYLVIRRARYNAMNGTTNTATQVSNTATQVKNTAKGAATAIKVANVAKIANVTSVIPGVNVVAGVAGVVGRTAKEVALRTIAVNMVIELAKVFGKVYDTTTAELILDSSDDGMDSKAAGYVLSLIPLIGSALQDSSDADAMETLGWAVAEGLFEGRF